MNAPHAHLTILFSKNTGIFLSLIVSTICVFPAYKASSQPVHGWGEVGKLPVRYIDPTVYGASKENWAITQDSRGLLYVANSEGLLVHDGVSWERVDVPGRRIIRSLAVSDDDTIFIGGAGELGYLGYDSQGHHRFISLKPHIPASNLEFSDVWQTLTLDESVYFRTDDHLFRWHRGTMTTFIADSFFVDMVVLDGRLILLQANNSLVSVQGDSLHELTFNASAFSRIGRITLEGTEHMLAFSDQGLIRCRIDPAATSDCVLVNTDIDELLRPGLSYTMLSLPGGDIAIGFDGMGLALLSAQGQLLRHFDEEDGLMNQEVMGLFTDRTGALWLALYDGIARLEPYSSWTSFGRSEGLPSSVMEVARYNGRLFAATMLGLYELVPGDGYDTARFEKLIDSETFTNCFDLQRVGDLLLAGCSNGLVQIETAPGRIARTVLLLDRGIFSIAENPDEADTFFAGGREGLFHFRVQGKSVDILHEEPLSQIVYSVLKEPARQDFDRLWAISYSWDLYRVDVPHDGSSWRVEKMDDQHGIKASIDDIFFAENRLHVVTKSGLYALQQNGSDVPHFEPLSHIKPGDVTYIGTDLDDHVWVDIEDDIYLLEQVKNREPLPFSIPPRLKTVLELSSLYQDTDGTRWFAHGRGVARWASSSSRAKPSVMIRQLSTISTDSVLFSGALVDQSELSIPYESASLRFEYAAQLYDLPERVRYRTWLEGFQETWQAWSHDHAKEFTNLSEGSYTFHVQASEPGDQLSEEVVFTFDVLPPWYRTDWAYLLWLLLTGAAVSGLIVWYNRFKTHRLKSHNHTLKRLVDERTAEIIEKSAALEEANEELRWTNDDLLRSKHTLEERTDQLREALDTNKEILGITAHDLKNPLGGIIGLADIVLLDSENKASTAHESVKENLPMLKEEAERMLRIVKELLDKHRQGDEPTLTKERVLLNDIIATVIRWNELHAYSGR